MTWKQQERFIRENILPWQLLRLYCEFTTPAKNKHLLLISLYPNPLLLMINSKIHPYIKSQACLKATQVLLSVNDHYFLPHDSYIDCREVYSYFTLDNIIEQVKNDQRRIRGFINEDVQEQIIAAIKISPVLETRYKNLILAELTELCLN
ncbi:MAG: hypothetical protein KAH84_06580 [Thiomargarita sp.]|nr:hypothetical protein [Thiomargarita sp.]